MIIYFGLFAVIALWVIRRPGAAVGALLCTYGIEQWAQSQSAFFYTQQWLTNLMTAGVLLFALANRFVFGANVVRPLTREYWAAVAIYGFAGISIIWSINSQESWYQFSSFIKYIVLFAFLMPMAIGDIKDLRTTMFALLTLGFGVCLLLLINSDWQNRSVVFKHGAAIGAIGLERGNPLAIATLGGQIALAAWLMNFRGVARFWQIFRYAVIGVGFALAVRSGSRGQTFALLIAALALTPYSRRFKDFKSFLGLVVSLTLFIVVSAFVFDKLTTVTSSADISDSERWSWSSFVEAYEGGRVNTSLTLLRIWFDGGPLRWIIGLGSSASWDTSVLGIYPHVVFLEVIGELGVVGWLILWLTPIYAFQNLRTLWGYVKDDPEERGLIAAWGALFFFDLILSFKQGSLLGSSLTFGMAIVLGRVAWSFKQQDLHLQQLDAGAYAMTDADWQDEYYEEEPEPSPQGAAAGRS